MASSAELAFAAKSQRTLITPEGVDLRLRLATGGQRAGAFMIDFLIIIVALIVLTVAAISLFAAGSGGAALIIWLLGFFLLRNFYFIAFEMGRRSATLGKRMAGLRVVARDGGRLTADAVIARNLMREIEVFLPISFVFSQGAEGVDGWIALLGFGWAAIFLFFPLFNGDRLRVGDIIAGTWVVHIPKRKLAADLAEEGRERLGRYAFSEAQLEAYGVYELQTLETVLRQRNADTMTAVAATIRAKLGWPYGDDDYDFLSAYYAALNARLERGLLFGKRRKDKWDTGG
ncbi:MAG: RDD family protein [Sphingomonadaceae bacterium]|nr:RDD family protein [Sphingomonadaceae bacterium]